MVNYFVLIGIILQLRGVAQLGFIRKKGETKKMRIQTWILHIVASLVVVQGAGAIVHDMGDQTLSQPDGSVFKVRVYKDELGLFMLTNEGHVIKNPRDGYYYYATFDEEGNVTPTDWQVGDDHPRTDLANLREANAAALSKMGERFREGTDELRLQPAAKPLGTLSDPPDSLIVILVEFSDVKHQNPQDWPDTSLPGGGKSD